MVTGAAEWGSAARLGLYVSLDDSLVQQQDLSARAGLCLFSI